jgi:hypothetical protein
MKKLFFLLVMSLNHVIAQPGFQYLYGGPDHERAQNVFPFQGGYIVNSTTKSFGAGYYDACIFKTNNTGQVLWGKTYGQAGFDNSECALKTFDQNIICAGRTELIPGGQSTAIIFKLDSTGNLLWSRSYAENQNSSFGNIIETNDHGYAAVGYLSNGANKDAFFVRTDINGDTLFSKSFQTADDEVAINVIQAPDSSFFICGRIVNAGTADAFLVHANSAGNILWTKRYGGSAWDEFNCLKVASDSELIITGGTTSSGAGTYDILLAKSDMQGNIKWANTYGGLHTDAAYDLRITGAGYILSGYTETFVADFMGDDSTNMMLMKTDFDGNFLWMEVYGDGLQDEGFHCELDDDGGFLVPGFTLNYLFTDSTQMLVIKTDSSGISGCHELPATPDINIYAIGSASGNFIEVNVPVSDTIVLTQNSASISYDDACLFAAINNPADQGFNLFPVPVKDQLNITSEGVSGNVLIYSSSGALVYSGVTGNSTVINTQSFTDGFYTVVINSERKIIRKNFCIIR